ncbi:hypothetical protein [Hoeflea sp. TYP-13]|uniref:hypothetical protein n=1 Tax=Hoeflea sp. TYP-13 TaxID=3230023 RepID=UPI0034C5F423
MAVKKTGKKQKIGQGAPGPGRPKGVLNKNTRLLSHAILEAARNHGLDGEGTDELTGYCQFLAKDHPTSFATLLSKVLPMQVTGSGGGPISHEFTVTFKGPDK